jgi:hypothetical protein
MVVNYERVRISKDGITASLKVQAKQLLVQAEKKQGNTTDR